MPVFTPSSLLSCRSLALLAGLLIGLAGPVRCQDRTRNFILTRTYNVPLRDAAVPVSAGEATQTLDYLDGLGRPQQTVNVQAGQNQRDVVSGTDYDAQGRPVRTYLPGPTRAQNGAFQPAAPSLITTFYNNDVRFADRTDRVYSETRYEASPLNRPIGQTAAGTSVSTTIGYDINTANDLVKRYEAGAGLKDIVWNTQNRYYDPGQLSVIRTTDEAGKVTAEFTDKNGRLVLRRQGANEVTDTYWVYDDLDRLRAVLQPLFQISAVLDAYAFLYLYDGRGRLIRKWVPSTGETSYAYNNRNLLISTTDPKGYVTQTEYDALNRPVRTYDAAGNDLTTTYYDTYAPLTKTGQSLWAEFPFDNAAGYGLAGTADFMPASVQTAPRKGQVTGGCVRQLNPDGTLGGLWLCSAIYYDDRYRVVQTVRRLPLGSNGLERISHRYDFGGKLLAHKTTQQWSGQTYTLERQLTYDSGNRLTATRMLTSSSAGTLPTRSIYLNAQTYNEIGQLSQTFLHATDAAGSKALERLSYKNNVRGWLREHRALALPTRPYALVLAYEPNGNIASQATTYPTPGFNTTYQFTYDELNRLLTGRTNGGTGQGESLTYDGNGNIRTLNRYDPAGTLIDRLTYTYLTSNRLTQIQDNSLNPAGYANANPTRHYDHDPNGNITYDPSRGATLAYNSLNLPRRVGLGATTLDYTYDTGGTKRSLSQNGSVTSYEGAFEYDGAGLPTRISTQEGQMVKNGSGVWQWQYYLRDHLGNVRVVLAEGGTVQQQTDYYPFGLALPKLPTDVPGSLSRNKYLYLNREQQPLTGYLDLLARHYDPTIGRFMQVDPLTEQQEHLSPYHYGYNNPLRFSDPDGECPTCIIGGIIGGVVEYGVQVATNVLQNDGKITTDAFTKNINISSIALATAEGALTQGASAGRTLGVKAAVLLVNNAVELKTDGKTGKFGFSGTSNVRNILKNAALDGLSNQITGGIGKSIGSTVKEGFSKLMGEGGNKLATAVKADLRRRGDIITREVNQTVKAQSKVIAVGVPKQIGKTSDNAVKAIMNPYKDEIKNRSNQ